MSPPQSQPSTPRPEARAPLGTRKDCVAAPVAGRHCRSPDGGLRGHSWPDMGLPTVPGLLLPLVRRGGAQRSGQAGEGRLGLGRVEGRARPQACAGLPSHTAPLTRGPELGTSLKGQEGNGPRPGQAGNVVAGAHWVRRGSLLGNRKQWEKEGGSSQSPDGSARHVVVLGRGEARLSGRRAENAKQGLDAFVKWGN